jgi:hypothetical protein
MIRQAQGSRVHERWAHLRFSVIGQLLAAPPAKGELKAAITALAARTWQHPTTGDPVQFGLATIERWYYRARKERTDPVGVLRRKLRADAGQQVAISNAVRQAVLAQYAAHKSWSVQLHHDNLVALAETRPELIWTRSGEGRERAKQRGVHMGRPGRYLVKQHLGIWQLLHPQGPADAMMDKELAGGATFTAPPLKVTAAGAIRRFSRQRRFRASNL